MSFYQPFIHDFIFIPYKQLAISGPNLGGDAHWRSDRICDQNCAVDITMELDTPPPFAQKIVGIIVGKFNPTSGVGGVKGKDGGCHESNVDDVQ